MRARIWRCLESLHPAAPVSNIATDAESAKALGAYYTAQEVADFLVWWAVRSPTDRVIDPSFGGGVFLRSACKRLLQLKGSPASQVYGVEIDPAVYTRIAEKLTREFGVRSSHLYPVDFFDFDGPPVEIDAVVGNPPFIRYQRFAGDIRQRALVRAAQEGVKLSELCSSWAPFVVHSVSLLREGGRLAMVVPAELGHAAYARPLLEYLEKSFESVSIATFRKKLFPELSEETYLLLAEGRGMGPGRLLLRDFAHAEELARFHHSRRQVRPKFKLEVRSSVSEELRFTQCFLPEGIRRFYDTLKQREDVKSLGDIADVGIGYVTGANAFFHLGSEDAARWEIPPEFLRPTIRNARGFRGLRMTVDDWRAADGAYLLHLNSRDDLPAGVEAYVADGESRGVHHAYKCRTRKSWFQVPHVYEPDAVLTYMSGASARLVANAAGAVAPNTLHVVRLLDRAETTAMSLASLWPNALTRLSVEIEGHSLGGGMLKLEPTEAERVLIPATTNGSSHSGLAEEMDELLRAGRDPEAQELADRHFLQQGLGLSRSDCALLYRGMEILRDRRHSRSVS